MTLNRTPRIALPLLLAMLTALGGCGENTSRQLGFTRDAPDEFQVTTRAPLSVPPRLGDLPTPTPGASRPQEAGRSGVSLLGGEPVRSGAAPSGGERALLSQAGTPADGGIRRRVDEESLRLDRPDAGVVDRMMFWRADPQLGIAVDAQREAQRLRENAALGRDQTDGQTPVVQPRRPSLWESIFGS